MARPITAATYKKLCRKVHRLYGASLSMSYFESCACVDAVYFGECTEATLFELLDEAVEGDL